MLFWGLPGLLDIKLDILKEVDTKVGVGADTDGEVVGALLAGGRELKLHLLLGDQRGEMVGGSDERVGLPVRDIHPPGQTLLDWGIEQDIVTQIILHLIGVELTRTPVYHQCSRDSAHCGTPGTFHSGPSRVCSFPSGTWNTE